jgi:hypothetical protein
MARIRAASTVRLSCPNKEKGGKLTVMVLTCILTTWEEEEEESQVWSQFGLHSKILSQKRENEVKRRESYFPLISFLIHATPIHMYTDQRICHIQK